MIPVQQYDHLAPATLLEGHWQINRNDIANHHVAFLSGITDWISSRITDAFRSMRRPLALTVTRSTSNWTIRACSASHRTCRSQPGALAPLRLESHPPCSPQAQGRPQGSATDRGYFRYLPRRTARSCIRFMRLPWEPVSICQNLATAG